MELHSGLGAGQAGEAETPAEGPFFGELRVWYNQQFLPRMESRLLQVASQPAKEGKVKGRSSRLPLKSLSAQDINARQGRQGK